MTPPGAPYRLDLGRYWTEPPEALRANHASPHWSGRSKATREVREAVVSLGHVAGLHRLHPVRHVTAQVVWSPGDHRRADPGNLFPLSKAAIDGLTPPRVIRRKRNFAHYVGLGLVPDDTDTWVTELTPRIDRPPTPAGLWFHLWVET